ncbi:uncharacterized protein LOC111064541 isoform X2 [Nilaparvata lugens]|uniref:uncharacterized protein LOC111064541 isoform X1 n=1 Tax=Nilaparvata lugens TaxID=108931 RepID=UPI00193DA23F|nr:uncharacterized protein LOC111064541 isoform X1 [Nilaparvata lugens]XP_039281027.1 uncharacterized protein LOC111064541 isoform X2 [Nilaparvata lugens]
METKKLIELVRERRLIYDVHDTDYRNRDKKTEAWMEIANQMGRGNGKQWCIKWKNLKDNYNRFLKSNQCQTGQEYKKYRNWPWAELLRFLDDFKFERTGEIHIPEVQVIIKEDDHHKNRELNIEEVPVVINTSLNRTREVQQVEQPEDIIVKYIEEKIKQNTNTTMDEVDLFFLSYARSFKKLSPRMQAKLKLDIATLFARYELQAAGETSSR